MFTEAQPAFGKPANGQWVNTVLLNMDPLRERGGRVVQLYRNNCLYDQWAAIEFLSDEVHAAAMFGFAGLQHALVRVQTLVVRQQGGVDIEQATLIVAHEPCAENAHESGQYHQVRLEGVDQFDQCCVEGLAAVVGGVIQYAGFDTRVSGALQTERIFTVGNHRANADGAGPVLETVDHRLQVAAGAGEQHHDIAGGRHQCA